MVISQYSYKIFEPEILKAVIDSIQKEVAKIKYDVIAFRGTSGAGVAFPLSYLLQKPLLHIRKPGGHSKYSIEGEEVFKRYIIVDDFVDSGDTLREIKEKIADIKTYPARKRVPVCAAIILYSDYLSLGKRKQIEEIFPKTKVIVPGHS